MKTKTRRQRKRAAHNATLDREARAPLDLRASRSEPKRKHLGKVQGTAPMARADRKPRRSGGRRAKEFGGGLPPAANDNQDFEMTLRNWMKNWRAGEYPPWRKDIANTNQLLPLPGGKK